jgi:hypothetical protein
MLHIHFFLIAIEVIGGALIIATTTLTINDTQRAIDQLRNASKSSVSFNLYDAAVRVLQIKSSFVSTKNLLLFVCLFGLSGGSMAAYGFKWYDSVSMIGLVFYFVTGVACSFFLTRNFKKYYGDRYGSIDWHR